MFSTTNQRVTRQQFKKREEALSKQLLDDSMIIESE